MFTNVHNEGEVNIDTEPDDSIEYITVIIGRRPDLGIGMLRPLTAAERDEWDNGDEDDITSELNSNNVWELREDELYRMSSPVSIDFITTLDVVDMLVTHGIISNASHHETDIIYLNA